VRRSPTDAESRAELANAYLAQRDFVAARKTASDIERLKPDWAAGPYLLGLAEVGLNDFESAQRDFAQALNMQPRSFESLNALVRVDQARGQLSEATGLVRKAVDEDPSSAAKINLLGELYIAQKNPALAAGAFERATRASPAWWVAYRNWARALAEANDTAGAIAAYQAGIKAAAPEPQLVIELATLYESQRRVDEAIGLCDTWYRNNPRAPSVASTLALLLATYRSDRTSLDRARELSAPFVSSSDARLLDTNGWVHFKRAEYAEALPVLQRALERAPESREIRYHLGMAELRSGQRERARGDLEAALAGSARFLGADQARLALAGLNEHAG
jgi:tetratricopeptide (TPR) repeat protein